MAAQESRFTRRTRRTRYALKQRAGGKLRLSVFRSNKHLHAQIIDDSASATLVSASTTETSEFSGKQTGAEKAAKLGALIAKRAKDKKLSDVVFDRGGYRYHGRVKLLAEAAREAGLKF